MKRYAVGLVCLTFLFGCKKECILTVTRQSCPGQEKESFRHCDGKETCQEIKKVENERACQLAAYDSCRNRGQIVTKLKVVTAKFNGQPIHSLNSRPDFCEVDNLDVGFFIDKYYPFKGHDECKAENSVPIAERVEVMCKDDLKKFCQNRSDLDLRALFSLKDNSPEDPNRSLFQSVWNCLDENWEMVSTRCKEYREMTKRVTRACHTDREKWCRNQRLMYCLRFYESRLSPDCRREMPKKELPKLGLKN